MKRLSITTAWNETAAFVRSNAGPLFTIAFALMVLPGVVFQVLSAHGAAGSGAASALASIVGLAMLVLSLVGSIAISALALGRERVFGSAIAHGFRRFLPLLGVSLLLALVMLLVAVPLIMVSGLKPEDFISPAPTPDVAGRLGLVMLVLVLLLIIVWVRLMLMTPVAAAEPGGPIAIIRRSWQLTGGHFWKLFGFILLFMIAFLVVIGAATTVLGLAIGLITGSVQPATLGGLLVILISGLLNALFLVLLTSMIARIYAQLTGAGESTVFD